MQKKPRDVPEAWLQLKPELLISEHWEHIPAPDPGWIDQRIFWARRVFRQQPWTSWSASEWLIAMLITGVALSVLGNVFTVVAEARRAAAIHQ
jgi:hypothetical protein